MADRSPYHAGELEVQERAGARDMAARIARGIRTEMPPVAVEFLAEQRLAVLGWVDDADGRVWASAVTGEPGFLAAPDPHTVEVRAGAIAGEPLEGRWPREIGLIAIDFANRRRVRVNGEATRGPGGWLTIQTRQVYSNCPKYIQPREALPGRPGERPAAPLRAPSLTDGQAALVARADTFFVASYHREGGADASHRGGSPGFIRVVDPRALLWPDYDGNRMFQTLGNFAVDGRAGLLFIDFDTGSTLQLSGRARTVWAEERAIRFDVEAVVEIRSALPLRWWSAGPEAAIPR